jgi:hypothetical protein
MSGVKTKNNDKEFTLVLETIQELGQGKEQYQSNNNETSLVKRLDSQTELRVDSDDCIDIKKYMSGIQHLKIKKQKKKTETNNQETIEELNIREKENNSEKEVKNLITQDKDNSIDLYSEIKSKYHQNNEGLSLIKEKDESFYSKAFSSNKMSEVIFFKPSINI